MHKNWQNCVFRATKIDALKWKSLPEEEKKNFCKQYLYIDDDVDLNYEEKCQKNLRELYKDKDYEREIPRSIRLLEEKFEYWIKMDENKKKLDSVTMTTEEEDQMLINMVKTTVGYNESDDKKEFMKGVSVAIHIFRKELSKPNSLLDLTNNIGD